MAEAERTLEVLESGSGEETVEEDGRSQAEYVKYMEEKLADTLSQIEGAGGNGHDHPGVVGGTHSGKR